MATKNFVPRATGEGGIGTALKKWLNGYFVNIFGSSLTLDTGASNQPIATLKNTTNDTLSAELLFVKDRDAGSATTGDLCGVLECWNDDSAGNQTQYANFQFKTPNITDGTESGQIRMDVAVGGTLRQVLTVDGDAQAEVIINEDSEDVDFRVESDGNANALFVQGSDGFIGIGTETPTSEFHIRNVLSNKPILKIENTFNNTLASEMHFIKNRETGTPTDGDALGTIEAWNDNSSEVQTKFADITFKSPTTNDGTEAGEIRFDAAVGGALTEFMSMTGETTPEVVFNEGGEDINFRVETDLTPNGFVIDGGDTNFGFATVQYGGGAGVLAVGNAATPPGSTPAGGGVLYAEGGALKWKGSSGTITTIANA